MVTRQRASGALGYQGWAAPIAELHARAPLRLLYSLRILALRGSLMVRLHDLNWWGAQVRWPPRTAR